MALVHGDPNTVLVFIHILSRLIELSVNVVIGFCCKSSISFDGAEIDFETFSVAIRSMPGYVSLKFFATNFLADLSTK